MSFEMPHTVANDNGRRPDAERKESPAAMDIEEKLKNPVSYQIEKMEAGIEMMKKTLENGAVLTVEHLNELQKQFQVIRGLAAAQEEDIKRHREEARTDALTGLPNRRDFTEKVTLEFGLLRRYERETLSGQVEKVLSVLHVDLDHFIQINDTYGHDADDRYLRIAAEHMKAVLNRKGDVIGRIGGDEFIIAVITKDPVNAERVAAHIKEAVLTASIAAKRELEQILGEPLPADRGNISASVGCATMKSSDETVEDLLLRADYTGRVAKELGRNAFVTHDLALALDADGEIQKKFMSEKRGPVAGASPDIPTQ